MAERPLLLLAKPTEAAKAKKGGGGGGPLPRTAQEQLQRLGPRIDQLTEALENKRLRLQSTTTGLQPEEVLVLETAGAVDESKLSGAARREHQNGINVHSFIAASTQGAQKQLRLLKRAGKRAPELSGR